MRRTYLVSTGIVPCTLTTHGEVKESTDHCIDNVDPASSSLEFWESAALEFQTPSHSLRHRSLYLSVIVPDQLVSHSPQRFPKSNRLMAPHHVQNRIDSLTRVLRASCGHLGHCSQCHNSAPTLRNLVLTWSERRGGNPDLVWEWLVTPRTDGRRLVGVITVDLPLSAAGIIDV